MKLRRKHRTVWIEDVHCANPRHPDGPWHPAAPLPASWQWAERVRQWRRKRSYGCTCPPRWSL